MRNMSCALTKTQIRDGSKTVTRRDAWLKLQAGDLLRPVNKTVGSKKGERPHPLLPVGHHLRVVSVRREPLEAITQEDVIAEGFSEMTPAAPKACTANTIAQQCAVRSIGEGSA